MIPFNRLILDQGKNNWYSTILVRTEAGKTKIALDGLNKLCKELNPAFPFSYKFSDEEYAKLYKSDEVIGSLSVIFAVSRHFHILSGFDGSVHFHRGTKGERNWRAQSTGCKCCIALYFIVERISGARGNCICHCCSTGLVGDESLAH